MLLNRVRRLRWRLALAAGAWGRSQRLPHQHHETAKAVRMLCGHALYMQRAHFLSTHPSSEQRAQTLNDMQAPMRKFQTRALDVQAGQAPRQGHVNNHGHGHEHDWLNAPKASRPAIDESKAIALYSPRCEDFEVGCIELKGKQHAGVRDEPAGAEGETRQARCRDLASTVMHLDHRLDLSYHYLGVAAKGMGLRGRGRQYLERARRLGEDKTTSCVGSVVVSCVGPQTDMR